MNTFKTCALVAVVATALCAAAAAPVAVRVEIETLEVDAEGTQVVLTVQVSPEDRSRIGKNAMVRVMLDGDVPPGQSPLWAVRIEGDGSGRIETVWPPGEHALRVEISNPSGEHTGLWVGTVRIPGAEMASGDAAAETPVPEKTAVQEKELDSAAAAAGSVMAGASAPSPVANEPVEISESVEEIVTEQPIQMVDESPDVELPLEPLPEPKIEVEADAAPDIELPPEPEILVEADVAPDLELPPEPEIEVEADVAPEIDPAPEIAPIDMPGDDEVETLAPIRSDDAPAVVAGAAGTVAAAVPEKSAETPSKPERQSVEEPPSEPDKVNVESGVAVVEPLRADSVQPMAEPDAAVDPALEGSDAAPDPPTAAVATALEAWAAADPQTVDLTVVAFRGDEPATGLKPTDFNLEVGGKDATIEEVGGRDRAPLQLGIAVDVATGSSAGWSQSGGRLFSLVQRARGGRGHAFFAIDGRVGAWDGAPGKGVEATGVGGLPALIVDSLGRFEGRRGRTILVVVTDGRTDADKAAWKAATQAAANSGVPVLVIALWDDTFSQRIRKNLKTIADASGGGLFLAQGSDQLDRAAERFGPMIDAGVALRFVVPSGVALPAPVSVTTGDKTLEVTAPKGVR